MILQAIFFILALVILGKSADYLVDASAAIARKLKVSEFVIGVTIIAIGTTIPEFATAIFASVKHSSGIVIGNAIGSNIANIALILGLTAALSHVKVTKKIIDRDGIAMIFAATLAFVVAIDGVISRLESSVFLLLYISYILFLIATRKGTYNFKDFIPYFLTFKYLRTFRELLHRKKNQISIKQHLAVLIVSIAGILVGAHFLVKEAIYFAKAFQVPESLIGLSIIAIGTSVPELTVALTAAKKGYGAIAAGNIFGANIANIFLIIGTAGVIRPLVVSSNTIWYAIPFMIFLSCLLIWFMGRRDHINRAEGVVLLILYGIFMALVVNGIMA